MYRDRKGVYANSCGVVGILDAVRGAQKKIETSFCSLNTPRCKTHWKISFYGVHAWMSIVFRSTMIVTKVSALDALRTTVYLSCYFKTFSSAGISSNPHISYRADLGNSSLFNMLRNILTFGASHTYYGVALFVVSFVIRCPWRLKECFKLFLDFLDAPKDSCLMCSPLPPFLVCFLLFLWWSWLSFPVGKGLALMELCWHSTYNLSEPYGLCGFSEKDAFCIFLLKNK